MLVYITHTTAGVTINEHADPMVARDFEMALERIVPEDWGWQHIEEGEENAPTHIRASFMGPSVLHPADRRRDDGAAAPGRASSSAEFDGPRERSVHVSVPSSRLGGDVSPREEHDADDRCERGRAARKSVCHGSRPRRSGSPATVSGRRARASRNGSSASTSAASELTRSSPTASATVSPTARVLQPVPAASMNAIAP